MSAAAQYSKVFRYLKLLKPSTSYNWIFGLESSQKWYGSNMKNGTKSLIWEYQPLNKCGCLMVLEQGTAMAVSKKLFRKFWKDLAADSYIIRDQGNITWQFPHYLNDTVLFCNTFHEYGIYLIQGQDINMSVEALRNVIYLK